MRGNRDKTPKRNVKEERNTKETRELDRAEGPEAPSKDSSLNMVQSQIIAETEETKKLNLKEIFCSLSF